MKIKNIDKCSDEMNESASALPNIVPMARVANFNTGDVFSKAKQRQLKRELSRSKKRGDKNGAQLIGHKLRHEEAHNRYIITQKQREEIKPVSTEENQVVVQGRVTRNGYGVDCHLVSLVNEKGSLLQKVTTNKSGGFTLIDDSGAAYAIKVSNKEGKVLYQKSGLGLSPERANIYMEIELSQYEQDCDIKDPPQEDPKKEIEVPDIIGSEQAAARKLLGTRKLTLDVIGTVVSTKNIDKIAKQEPKAGEKVEVRSAIKVWIGKEQESDDNRVEVPNIIGSDQAAAKRLLAMEKLNLEVIGTVLSSQYVDKIAKQEPEAGDKVDIRSTVKVWIGKKQESDKRIEVPDVIGSKEAAAKKLLATQKLNLEVVGTVNSTKYIDMIAKQEPTSKSKVEPRTTVKVWIGERQKDIRSVDDFVGKSIHATVKVIDSNKLYSIEKIEFQKSEDPGKVMSQIPASGQPLKDATKVRLKVGVGDDEKDLAIARLILERNQEFQKLKISQSKFTKVLKGKKVQGLADLRKLSRTSMKALTATFGLGGIEEARTLKSLLVDVTNQLKG